MTFIPGRELRTAFHDVPVLLLGAGGFIGRWVAHYLFQAGAELLLPARDPQALQDLFVPYGFSGRVLTVDLAVSGSCQRLCQELRPAVAFNLAGYGVDPTERDAELAYAINCALPEELARGLGEWRTPGFSGKALVQAGSALEYGPVSGPISEVTPSAPTTLYGQSKWAGAQRVAALCGKESSNTASRAPQVGEDAELPVAGLTGVEGRIFTAFGPGEHAPRLLPSLHRARRELAEIPLTLGEQRRDFIYVKDVAESLLWLSLLRRPGFDIANVASSRLTSVREFVTDAAAALGLPASRLKFGALPYRAEEMWHGEVQCELLRQELHFQPRYSLSAALVDAVEFMDGQRLR